MICHILSVICHILSVTKCDKMWHVTDKTILTSCLRLTCRTFITMYHHYDTLYHHYDTYRWWYNDDTLCDLNLHTMYHCIIFITMYHHCIIIVSSLWYSDDIMMIHCVTWTFTNVSSDDIMMIHCGTWTYHYLTVTSRKSHTEKISYKIS